MVPLKDFRTFLKFFHLPLIFVIPMFFGCSEAFHNSTLALAEKAERYSSPDQAVEALNKAAQAKDKEAIVKILGPESITLVDSGDAVADRNALNNFAVGMTDHHSLEAKSESEYVLIVGKKEWPFPIPIVKIGEKWIFDTAQGKEEILNRRIGENELKTIRVALTYVDAQKEYFRLDPDGDGVREYAKKIASTPGTHDGLYWASTGKNDQSPLGPFAAGASAEGYRRSKDETVPYHGYYFKVLTEQGDSALGGRKNYVDKRGKMKTGFALLAYPARWGNSGIMSFIVNQDAIVYEKDFGLETLTLASHIKEFNPDPSWKPVSDLDEVEVEE